MSKFRKKPVVIEAELISQLINAADHDWDALPDWVIENYENGKIIFFENSFSKSPMSDHISILTDEGTMRGDFNDYLIQGVNGEIYPCKPDVFEKTYEKVE
jgi:hypothetical protein